MCGGIKIHLHIHKDWLVTGVTWPDLETQSSVSKSPLKEMHPGATPFHSKTLEQLNQSLHFGSGSRMRQSQTASEFLQGHFFLALGPQAGGFYVMVPLVSTLRGTELGWSRNNINPIGHLGGVGKEAVGIILSTHTSTLTLYQALSQALGLAE